MHYYQHHIGDYRANTAHLTNDEDLAYRRLIEMYYDTESPIPLETQWVARRLRLGTDALEVVLNDFFTKGEDGWHNARCDAEIAYYHAIADKNRANGKLGGRPKKTQSVTSGNPVGTQSKPTGKPTNNHKPVTNNQYSSEFEQAWAAYPDRPGKSKADAFKAWSARLKAGEDPQAMIDGAHRYADYCAAAGTEPGYIKQPATFFGPGEHYKSDWNHAPNNGGGFEIDHFAGCIN